jgi:hypothetical protein
MVSHGISKAYQARYDQKSLGYFATAEEAARAYLGEKLRRKPHSRPATASRPSVKYSPASEQTLNMRISCTTIARFIGEAMDAASTERREALESSVFTVTVSARGTVKIYRSRSTDSPVTIENLWEYLEPSLSCACFTAESMAQLAQREKARILGSTSTTAAAAEEQPAATETEDEGEAAARRLWAEGSDDENDLDALSLFLTGHDSLALDTNDGELETACAVTVLRS